MVVSMKAKFIGNASLGFKHGKIYNLESSFVNRNGKQIYILLQDPKLKLCCTYDSVESIIKK